MNTISQKGRFCAVCGTSEEPFLENLCENCYLKEHPLEISVIENLEIEICPLCGTVRVLGAHIRTWNREETLEEIIRDVAKQTIIEKIQTDVPYDYKFDDDLEDSKIFNYGVKNFTITTNILAKPQEEFGFIERSLQHRLKFLDKDVVNVQNINLDILKQFYR